MLQTFYEECLFAINPNAASVWPDIARAYAGRAYHNPDHLTEMLGHYRAVPTTLAPASAPLFGLALIYHDIVYVAGHKDNEARSADLLDTALREYGTRPEARQYCRSLIMATKTHEAMTNDEGLLVDLDLAVLAREPDGYAAYAKAVREEFSHVPGLLYRPGRKKVLQRFLEREYLYHHPYCRERWEADARRNLELEISQL